MRIKTLLATIIFLSLAFLLPPKSHAETFDLSVSPPIFQIEITPPAVADVNQQIILENTGNDNMNLTINLKLFRPEGNNGEITYLKEGERYGNDPDILKRIHVKDGEKEIQEVFLSSHSKKKLNVVIEVPKDEPPSDYYFSILFTLKSEQGKNGGSYTQAVGGVAVNTLLSIGPKGSTKGLIEEFSTDLFRAEGPVPFIVTIKNNSEHFIFPEASIAIRNMFGQTVGKVELLPVNILSHAKRSLPSKEQFIITAAETDKKTKSSKQNSTVMKLISNASQPVAVWPETFLLGPYSATLTIALSETGPLYVKTIHFFAFPLHLLFGLIIVLFLLITIRKRLKQRKIIS